MTLRSAVGILRTFRYKSVAAALVALLSCSAVYADDDPNSGHTVTPIKHVIVLIGENRSFDNAFGTYISKHGQSVSNLLSKGIVDSEGRPGPHHDLAQQFTVNTLPDKYFINVSASNKTAYTVLPPPNTSYVPAVGVTFPQVVTDPLDVGAPFDATSFTTQLLGTVSPVLPLEDLPLLTTGATGLHVCNVSPTKTYPTYPPQGCNETDTRISNYAALPNTVFPISGRQLPYDSYTGDMVHRFFHMWQQSDCDASAATTATPSGCRNDLYPYVGVARKDGSGGNSMGFYNMQEGDAPVLERLADEYTISDNFHQSVMGGTFVQHMILGTADALFWDPYVNSAGVTLTQPPASVVANPDPNGPMDDSFKNDKSWTACADPGQPGVKAIQDYLKSLPWHPDQTASNCEDVRYYLINNVRPGFRANGTIDDAGITKGSLAPPSSLRNIGDALNEKKISWAYYGGGYDAAVRVANGSTDPIDLLIGSNGDFYCDICNPFQYSKSIMGDPAQRKAHIKDAIDFFEQLDEGTLPAVAYVKPDSFDDGHPASSKLDLFEALIDRIHRALKANPALFQETAFFVAWDEGGGYWDSGFYQPIDFFGDGPRIPFIVVSPYAKGGRVVHTYEDHVSILKFIERNWNLRPLTRRSRDNLPNPKSSEANPYVPVNMPAVGDLFDLFQFEYDQGGNN